MTVASLLSDAQRVIGRHWSPPPLPEQARILTLASEALHYISATGQWYPLEDFRGSRASGAPSQAQPPHSAQDESPARGEDGPGDLRELLSEAEGFFERLRNDPERTEEKEPIQLILDTLQFISSTGQYVALGEFIKSVESHAPPYVVAAFETQEEARAWLERHPSPPVFASILIASEYHDVVHERETGFRRLPWNRHLHRYLAWLKRADPPAASASFTTRGEAEEWLKRQSNPARRTWVAIAGELYLAVYHPNINHRALYPLSMAEGHEDESG
jgi:hypothetical protein